MLMSAGCDAKVNLFTQVKSGSRSRRPSVMGASLVLSDEFIWGSTILALLALALWAKFGAGGPEPEARATDARRRGRLSVRTEDDPTSADTMLAGGDMTSGRGTASGAGVGGSGAGAGGSAPGSRPRTQRTVATTHGPLTVIIDGGDDLDHDMVTVHDVGCTARTCFGGFFQISAGLRPFDSMRVIHVVVPGQEAGAANLSGPMPSMEHLAVMVAEAMTALEITRVVGFGVGAGVNVLLRLARMHPRLVDGIISVGGTKQAAGWAEQAYSRVLDLLLRTQGLSNTAKNIVMDQHFSAACKRRSCYRDQLRAMDELNPHNLRLFLAAYRARDEITVESLTEFNRRSIPVLCFAGPDSHGAIPMVPGPRPIPKALDLYGCTDLTVSSWMKVTRVGDWITLESPAELFQPMVLFLRSFGYT